MPLLHPGSSHHRSLCRLPLDNIVAHTRHKIQHHKQETLGIYCVARDTQGVFPATPLLHPGSSHHRGSKGPQGTRIGLRQKLPFGKTPAKWPQMHKNRLTTNAPVWQDP